MKKIVLTLVFVPLAAVLLHAQDSDRRDVRSGNRKFDKGEFREAVVDYQKALLRDSTSFAASYNLANALYRMENYQEASSVLDTIAGQAPASEHASDYYFNKGNTAVALKNYSAAVDAYREALLRNPGDMEAKENYVYARKKLEDQQNNQNNQDQQDNQDQNDRNQNDQDNGGNDDRNQDRQNDDRDGNDGQNQDQNQEQNQPQSGQQPQSQPQISKQAAQQMLNAIMAKEKETQDKVKKEKAAVMKSKQREKNW